MDNKMRRATVATEVKAVDEAERVIEFVGSNGALDRDGEVINPKGWDITNFKKNPVFLWAHEYYSPPVGRALNVKKADGGLTFRVQFADAETYPFADTIYRMYKAGFLHATSVGFIPKEWVDGDGEGSPRRTYTKQELLELSAVPVPSNPEALIQAQETGVITAKEYGQLAVKTEWSSGPSTATMTDLTPLPEWPPQDSKHDPFSPINADVIDEECAKGQAEESFTKWSHHDDSTGKPLENEHACRLRNPDDFDKWSFRRTERQHEGKKYAVISGQLKGEDEMTEQSFRYDKDKWDTADARKHCKAHDGKFEAVRREAEMTQVEITDELDYCRTIITDFGLSNEARDTAWNVVREVLRYTGGDMPEDIIAKIGAVLNGQNKSALRQAQHLIQGVLDSADAGEETVEDATTGNIVHPITTTAPSLDMASLAKAAAEAAVRGVRHARGTID